MKLDFDYDQFVEAFTFLDELRESGVTNMFGAVPYITEELAHDRNTSKELLALWMQTYDSELAPFERVEKLQQEQV